MMDRLLRPTSIAVIGGGSWCRNVLDQCRRIGFAGDLWWVHPTKGDHPDLAALPRAPDAAFVGVNSVATVEVVRALSAMGAGGAVCFASGFSEAEAETAGGTALQVALLEAAGEMPFLGPNCYGFLNYLDGAALWPDQHGGVRVERGVAIVTQSSNIALNLTMQARGLPLAYAVTAGNQAQRGIGAIGRGLLADPRVTALGLHVEGIDDLRGLEALAAEAHALGKGIVALKAGRSEQAQAAAISHTASLAGSDAGARALFARLGIGQVDSLPALLETLKLLHVAGPLPSNRIASMSCSGGEASLMADAAEGTGLDFPPLDATQRTALRTALGPKVALANPLDYHTYIWNDEDAMTACFSAMMQGDLAMGCVVLDLPRSDRCDPADWDRALAAVRRTAQDSGKTMAVIASLPETMPEATAARLIGEGIVPFSGIAEALAALAVAARMGPPDPQPLLLPPRATEGRTLDEAEAKALLEKAGLAVPRSRTAVSPDEAARAARRLNAPVVLKGRGIAHKTEAGAVALGLTSPQEVRAAAEAMPCESFLVEEMVAGAVAEVLVGIVCDPAHGYVLTLAAGGTLAELLQDRVSLLVPASRDAVGAALDRLRLAPVLAGYRGKPGADRDAILDAVMALQALAADLRPQEIEINPLICNPTAAIAADALIRLGDPT